MMNVKSHAGFVKGILVILIILPILAGCGGGGGVVDGNLTPEQQATLDSYTLVQIVGSTSLYELTYIGDYASNQFRQIGCSSDTQLYQFLNTYVCYCPTSRTQISPSSNACATISAKNAEGHAIIGRNYDGSGYPLIIHTKPSTGYASVTIVNWPVGKTSNLLWTPYFAMDGMNEAGLAVTNMSAPGSISGHDPNKLDMFEYAIIRVVLEYAKSVDEAIAIFQSYNMFWDQNGQDPDHFLIADKSGDSAVVEFVNGQFKVVRSGKPWQVCTNYLLYGTEPANLSHCERYSTAWTYLANHNGVISNTEAMSVMSSISQDFTLWSVVYDLESGEIQLAVNKNYQHIKTFNLSMLSSH